MDTSAICLKFFLNIVSYDEHVTEVEYYIRTIKERTRSICNSLPFKKYYNQLRVENVYGHVFWLNALLATNGILQHRITRNIITGSKIDYLLYCQLECGSYVQTHEGTWQQYGIKYNRS